MEGFEPPWIAPFALEANASPIPPHARYKMVVLSGNAPDSYASPAINCVISTAAFFKLQDHFKMVAGMSAALIKNSI